MPRREIPPQSPPILPCWGQATDARAETYSQEVRPYYSYLISIDSSRQSSEAYQDPPRLLPRQSSSSPDASSTPPPAEIIPPPRPPEPDLPAEVQPASPLPSQQPAQPPLPRILLQRSGDEWRIVKQHNIHMLHCYILTFPFLLSHTGLSTRYLPTSFPLHLTTTRL